MENKNKWIFGITLSNFDIDDCYKKMMKKEHNLTAKEIKELKTAYLFRLSDNIKFWQFDADIILVDTENETYYHTGDFEPIERVENKSIIALVDENCEMEMI